MSVIGESFSNTRVRVTIRPSPGQMYAMHSEVFLDENGREFVIVRCHFRARSLCAAPWMVELKDEPVEDDAPWTMQYFEGETMQVEKLTNISDVFAQPTAHYVSAEGGDMSAPVFLRNEYELGPTWTDFYKGSRKVARVYTLYYRAGIDVRGNVIPELLWVHAQEDDVKTSGELETGSCQ